MSRRRIKKQNTDNKVTVIPKAEEEGKAKRALKATARFFGTTSGAVSKAATTVGRAVKKGTTTGVDKGIVPIGKATGTFMQVHATQIKEMAKSLVEARQQMKALNREAGALAMLMETTSSKSEAIETLESLKQKMTNNLEVINAALNTLRKEANNDAKAKTA